MRLSVFFFIIYTGNCFSQTEWLTRNNINHPLQLLSPIEHFNNIYPIKDGIVYLNNDSINLKNHYNRYNGHYFESTNSNFKSYFLLLNKPQDSLSVILHFAYNKLIEISIFARGNYYLNSLKYDADRLFKNRGEKSYTLRSDSVVNFGNRIITYGQRPTDLYWYGSSKKVYFIYEESFLTGEGMLKISDKKSIRLFPSRCGVGWGIRNWNRLEKYLKKNSTHNNGR